MKWILSIIVILGLLYAPIITAQELINSSSVASYVTINAQSLHDGDIIVLENGSYRKSNKPYDFKMVGVYVQNPAVGINYKANTDRKAILTTGVAPVLVSGEAGSIKKGDSITSSSQPGIGMKAIGRGYILGTAMEDFASTNKKETKRILLSIGISSINTQVQGTVAGNIKDIFTLSTLALTESPTVVFKYLIGAIVVLASLIFAFILFGRSAANSIVSIGRNPLASRVITLGILLNTAIVITMVAGGVAVAYFLIKL